MIYIKIYLSLAFCFLITCALSAAQTAVVRFYSLSIAVHPGFNIYGDELSFTSTSTPAGADEFSPWPGFFPPGSELTLLGPEAYISGMTIYDATYQYGSSGQITLYLPPLSDDNNNRFPDFFEVSLVCTGASVGYLSYLDPYFGHVDDTLTATWSRAAGSKSGTCSITPHNDYWSNFVHSFEILEYKGSLSYTPGSNLVAASILLTQTGNPGNTMKGPLNFTKSPDDHFNQLTNQFGIWTNSTLQFLSFTNHQFLRDVNWPTSYAGYIEFDDDGDQNTFYPYAVWLLAINDYNDANQNGIPDFSDDPQLIAPPRRPQLLLTRSAGSLLLRISGDINHVHQVQESFVLPATNWQNVLSMTLTNDPQVVPLSLPAGTRFWRVQAF